MALFARRKHSGRVVTDAGEGDPQLVRRPTTIGELLRETREQYGTPIEQVGATLRIRPVFLQAIEGNHYDRLPGLVYAVGFVRTYADYLGLDGEAVAQRFKNEAAGLETKSDLSFPMPLPDRSLPGGALLLVALIVAACAYALWYYRAAGERARTERVAEVPSQLIPLPPRPAAPEPDAAAGSSATGEVPATGGATTGSTVPLPPASASSDQMAATPPPTAPPASSTAAGTPAAGPPAAEPPAGARPGSPAAAVPPSMQSGPTQSPPAQSVTAEPARLPAIPEPPGAAPGLDTPRVYGVTNGPVRVIVKANADSWVQVRDADQNAIWTRVLKQGESYRVPDRPGLILRTGNAGSLEITVDGRSVPPVGPVGKTRNAALDPERLIAGSATLE